MTDITELNIPSRINKILTNNGIENIEELTKLCRREIGAIPKIGPKSLEEIEDALEEKWVSLAEDIWEPYTCARQNKPSMDTSLRSIFLCDECARDFQNDAFNSEGPAYVGSSFRGHCSHCNRLLENIRLRQWYLCGVCDRVVRSIGRSVVAESYFHEWWNNEAKPYFPHLELRQTDAPELRPRTKEQIEAKVSQIDFTCIDSQTDEPVFGFELKTGRSHLPGGSIGSKMQRFQLDKSDCDDILVVVSRENIPVYLVHAQVMDRATPPHCLLCWSWSLVDRFVFHGRILHFQPDASTRN